MITLAAALDGRAHAGSSLATDARGPVRTVALRPGDVLCFPAGMRHEVKPAEPWEGPERVADGDVVRRVGLRGSVWCA